VSYKAPHENAVVCGLREHAVVGPLLNKNILNNNHSVRSQ